MELYTMDRNFHKQTIIDEFSSVIWTERYYGDSAIELVMPSTSELMQKLPIGIFIGLTGSDEIMSIETRTIENGKLKLSGISLLPWMNNRFVRTTPLHKDKHWPIDGTLGMPAGRVLWHIIFSMCCQGSPYLDGTINIGISNPERLVIPGLGLTAYDNSGFAIDVAVPFGPVYTAMREIATTYEVGMQILLEEVTDISYSLGFRSYKGLDHTSGQSDNSIVRFSPQMDSLTDIKELQSIAALKTLVYSFAPGLNPAVGDPVITTIPGVSELTGPQYTGFDLRALMIFADDITTDLVSGSATDLIHILDSRAYDALVTNSYVIAVDGEIVPESQFKYGVHYNLGDLIEVQGNSGAVQTARITE